MVSVQVFAEIKRDLLSERTKKGLQTVKAPGRLLGHPKGSLGKSRLSGKEQEIKKWLEKKVSKPSIAKIVEMSRTAFPRHPLAKTQSEGATTGGLGSVS